MVCLKGFVYLARGQGRSWLGFTHDPALDLTVLSRESYNAVVSLTPVLPVGMAMYILQELRDEPGPDQGSRGGFWPRFKGRVSRPGYWLRRVATGMGWQLTGRQEAADRELGYWSRRAAALLRGLAEPVSGLAGYPLHVYRPAPGGPAVVCTGEDMRRVAAALEGRFLFVSELEQALVESSSRDGRSIPTGHLEDLLHLLALVGAVQIFPSVILTGPDGARCVRCGQAARIAVSTCVRCGREKCFYCEECLAMGEARLCRPLYGLAADEGWLDNWAAAVTPWLTALGTVGPEVPVKPAGEKSGFKVAFDSSLWPVLNYALTPAQVAAGRQVAKWVGEGFGERGAGAGPPGWAVTGPEPAELPGQQGENDPEPAPPGGVLVWAACGAGKTEVSFNAIARVLAQGGKVLFAVPRRDVVIELAPRLEQAFPGVGVTALYGGSREKFAPGRLVVATTHQAIRFFRAFDLVVLDEVDAFPYQGSAMLYHAVTRARKRAGKLVLMTATPDQQMKTAVQKKRLALVTIPARHHGHPVPEPQIVVEKEWRWERDRLVFPERLLKFLHRSVEGDLAQVFVFVPSVFLAQRVGEALQAATLLPPFNDFKGVWVEYSHSRDPERESKRRRFSRQLFPIFVTTSIMERGITVPRANVVVLFAENERIYDDRTLIQMAGRAGRSTERPYGEVWFMGTRITPAMEEAVRCIKWL
ncbi:MAG: helicase-related protein, partial [Heliobacteriaceae bacterium]|nr:helicase-related protein [Heliobacteriaceae bacterium]